MAKTRVTYNADSEKFILYRVKGSKLEQVATATELDDLTLLEELIEAE